MPAVLVTALVTGLTVVAVQAARAWRYSNQDFDRAPMRFVAPSPIEGLQALALKTHSGLAIAASFVAPRNGVAVILAHGSDANRTQLWPEAIALAHAGIGVLAFDWPGMGESGGDITMGLGEREAFTACVDFLAAREDVQRIGALGFSQGAGLLTLFVAGEPRVKSLLAVNAWSDALDQIRYEYRRWGPIRQLPAVAAARKHIEGGNVRVLDSAPRLNGRKTLFVASLVDEVVPPQMSVDLAHAAGGQLRLVGGARHLTFRDALPHWLEVMVEFFSS